MDLITESKLRELAKNSGLENLEIKENTIITPSARQYLRDKKIELPGEKQKKAESSQAKTKAQSETEANDSDQISKGRAKVDKKSADFKYQSYYSGAYFKEKPEAMTQIFANKLVYKDHPLIEYRGKLDSFQSQILEVMLVVETEEIPGLYQDLEESLEIMRNILAAEVRDQEFNLETIIGLTAAEIRARSHNPQKYFSVKHILPSPDLGKILIKLNSLRSSVREVEIAAIKAFRDEKGIKRPDIIKALNRMSSVFYVMMCKYQAGKYKKEVI
ncbi:ethanolamine utilization cobalamin adenosyltransferase [Halanaerobium congolense]|uniref:Ethanolamine utilization cobalamin adenosyltransferase n=1 Tax=Halanaerobium congolense TaxID=54121 RepID=A0A1M7N1A0_9FIRM|nr:hypothetical protein [Halanaerobium congolense]KXS49437.1 MAG: ethanolamine utilization cobalamin adenosyltransferase [Halanaerobium sp. T82-1]OEG63738.1 MAG: hypothetical protein BHK79_04935 [Halanaerobium sp. MDAL1]PTX16110.1 ethanolamine utilization cobalamin adenosyltransferase [Halanaerobium congolense]TDX38432.1 ethanolamine utilization cobalamin adenosyltransferase [Halanaerobium congolense]SDF30163.1 ethanolamine utilization cobalamin adenosyltransferase [Halanaerobium congolense]